MTPAPSTRARHLAMRLQRSPRPLLGLMSTALLLVAVLAMAVTAAGLVTGRWRVMPVLSGSMRPAFDTGAALLVVSVPSNAVRAGDVIVYHPPIEDRRPIVHRVVEVVEPGARPVVRTQGDANQTPDPWVARLEGGSIWKVRISLPHLGRALVAMDTPGIRYGVLLMLILGLLVPGLRAIWRHPDQRLVGTRPWTLSLAAWEGFARDSHDETVGGRRGDSTTRASTAPPSAANRFSTSPAADVPEGLGTGAAR